MARDGEPPPVIVVISSDEEEDDHRWYVKREGEKRTRREKWRMFSGVEVKTAEEKVGDDDDCCIIGCNLSYALMKMNPLHEEEDDDDDVSIVFERGQCYCYVCDATAPCKYWTGLLGHCHASDTGSRWQNMRKASRSASAPNAASRPKLSW